ncbi:hypothetical protein AB0H63_02980 [Micromonospora echinospora]|uniref:hypothetical protein n=1 Tax=Micromonospora echinospora TaxID=1877 RepID=UPI0033DE5A98
MSRLRNLLVVAGVAVAATAVLPAAPAAADTTSRYAHAYFSGDTSLNIDVVDAEGTTTIDVSWHDSECVFVGDVYACEMTHRDAVGVPVTDFSFSLVTTTVAAQVPYEEKREYCEYVDAEEVGCTWLPTTTGTTALELTWTTWGDPWQEVRTDDEGRVHQKTAMNARVTGSAFGSTYGPQGSYGQLADVRTTDPAR